MTPTISSQSRPRRAPLPAPAPAPLRALVAFCCAATTLSLLSCTATDQIDADIEPGADQQEAPIGKWKLRSIANKGENVALAKAAGVTLEIMAAGKLRGNSGANSYDGGWKSDGKNSFQFTDFSTTEMAALDPKVMTQETLYTSLLLEVTTWEINPGGDLLLSHGQENDGDHAELRFTPFKEPASAGLAGTHWELTHMVTSNGLTESAEIPLIENGNLLTLTLHKNGKTSVFGGVNTSSGTYTIDNQGRIQVTNKITTLAAGDPWRMQQERKYLEFLSEKLRFNVRDNRLTLSNDEGNKSLQFKYLGSE